MSSLWAFKWKIFLALSQMKRKGLGNTTHFGAILIWELLGLSIPRSLPPVTSGPRRLGIVTNGSELPTDHFLTVLLSLIKDAEAIRECSVARKDQLPHIILKVRLLSVKHHPNKSQNSVFPTRSNLMQQQQPLTKFDLPQLGSHCCCCSLLYTLCKCSWTYLTKSK